MIDSITEFSPVTLRRDFDRLFDGLWGTNHDAASLPVDVSEDDQGFHVAVDVPGLALAELEVTAFERKLSIRGERKLPKTEGRRQHIQERSGGKLARTILMPVEIEADKIEAKLENGVLMLSVPKAAKARPRKIAVKAG